MALSAYTSHLYPPKKRPQANAPQPLAARQKYLWVQHLSQSQKLLVLMNRAIPLRTTTQPSLWDYPWNCPQSQLHHPILTVIWNVLAEPAILDGEEIGTQRTFHKHFPPYHHPQRARFAIGVTPAKSCPLLWTPPNCRSWPHLSTYHTRISSLFPSSPPMGCGCLDHPSLRMCLWLSTETGGFSLSYSLVANALHSTRTPGLLSLPLSPSPLVWLVLCIFPFCFSFSFLSLLLKVRESPCWFSFHFLKILKREVNNRLI